MPEFPEDNPKLVKRWTQETEDLDPQPAHRPVHHRGLRDRRQHPAPGDDPDARRPRAPAAHAAPRRRLHRRGLHAAPVREPAPPLERGLRRVAGRLHLDHRRRPAHRARRARRCASRSSAPNAGEMQVPDGWQETPEQLLQRSGLARTYALAQQLKEGTRTPEDYVQKVLDYLGDTAVYTYSETPPPASRTLDGFLFESKQGYCQQFSGAMALLLRMGGVPARVTTGFSTGATDTKTGEYIVRDFDAHSWVEAYYPDYGWLTFDPTPAASPARSQPADAVSISGSSSGAAPLQPQDLPVRARRRHPGRRRVAPLVALPAVRPRPAGRRRARVPRRPPLAPRRPARAERVRARAQAHPQQPRPGHHPARPRAELLRARPPPPATSARCARAATATPRPARPAPSAAACAPSSAAAAASSAASAPGGPCHPIKGRPPGSTSGAGLQLRVMDDVYDLYQRGMALLEDGHFHQATIPLAKARDLDPDKTSIREALGRAYFRSGDFENGARGVRGGRRARAHERLRAVLPRPQPDAARPHRRGPQAAHARGVHEPEAPRLQDLPRQSPQGGVSFGVGRAPRLTS